MRNEQFGCNMPEFLRRVRRAYTGRVMLQTLEGTEIAGWTGEEFFGLADRCASRLSRLRLGGKHLGIMGSNSCGWLANVCAVFMTGGVAVLLSPEISPAQAAERAAQADLAAIVCDDALRQTAAEAGLPVLPMNAREEEMLLLPDANPGGEDLACILFTSGSTAKPKAVMFSHRAVVAGICHNVVSVPFEAQLAVLPMHHIAGFASVFNTWYLGRRVCLGGEVRHLYRYLEYMKPDYVLTVPAVLQALLKKLKNAGPNGHNLGWNLHLVGCGGAAFMPEAVKILNDRNIRVLQSYGATEAGGIGFDWEMTAESAGTLGKPCRELETKILDGELYLRSPSLMSGYYKDPEATAQVLADGWYATGDLCEVDEKGFFHLNGRKRNVIILPNGENVCPEEIEQALMGCALMEEVLVGLKGKLITAFVLPRDGVGTQQIREAVDGYNRTVSGSRQVHHLVFFDEPFAKTEMGKIIRASVTGGN